jgi:hypothetical protein
LKDTGCTFCGAVDTSGYEFGSSIAVVNGKFAGLPLDESNEDGKTDGRIANWVELIKKEIHPANDSGLLLIPLQGKALPFSRVGRKV